MLEERAAPSADGRSTSTHTMAGAICRGIYGPDPGTVRTLNPIDEAGWFAKMLKMDRGPAAALPQKKLYGRKGDSDTRSD